MFSIYRRFDGDLVPNNAHLGQTAAKNIQARPMNNTKPSVGQGFGPGASLGEVRRPHTENPSQKGWGQPQKRQLQEPLPLGQRALPPPKDERRDPDRNHPKKKRGFLEGILPSGLYDSKTKKIFGVLTTEDLLLIALIFLLLEKDGEDNKLMVIALLYVLVSDYIDLSLFGF